KCYADEPLAVPFDGLHFDDKLQFVEELDREVKQLRQSHVPIVKIRWNSRRSPETVEKEKNGRGRERKERISYNLVCVLESDKTERKCKESVYDPLVSAYGTTKLKVSLTKLSLLFGRVLVREWPGLAFDEGDEVGKCFQEDCSYGIGGGSVSRSKVMGRVYAANEAPPDLQDIPFHHDMTFFLSVLFVKSVL
ncbi:hypothetical protein Tco_0574414, partial [Tanacetum coccineum]